MTRIPACIAGEHRGHNGPTEGIHITTPLSDVRYHEPYSETDGRHGGSGVLSWHAHRACSYSARNPRLDEARLRASLRTPFGAKGFLLPTGINHRRAPWLREPSLRPHERRARAQIRARHRPASTLPPTRPLP